MSNRVWTAEEIKTMWPQAYGELRGFERGLEKRNMGLTAGQLGMALQLAQSAATAEERLDDALVRHVEDQDEHSAQRAALVKERDEIINAVLCRVGKRWRSMAIDELPEKLEFNGPMAAIVADLPGAALTAVNLALDVLQEQDQDRIAELERRLKITSNGFPCAGCGGPHDFDTSVPSVVWNRVIRAQGLPEYLCLTCVVREFIKAGESFTATLWNEQLYGVPIEVKVNNQVATDAAQVSDENTSLRVQLAEIKERLPEGMEECTIRFIECPVGHGRLIASNWIDHGCVTCKLRAAEAEIKELKSK